jgi:hypothetical protein
MRTRTILVVAILIGVLTLPGTLLAQTQTSWFGTWKLNLAKSKYSPGPPPKSATVKVEPWENGLKVTTDAVTAQGETRHTEVSGKFDARDNPITGNPNADSDAFRRVNAHTYAVFAKKDGKATTTTRVVISTDGKTRTTTTTGKNAQGQNVDNTAVYDRM